MATFPLLALENEISYKKIAVTAKFAGVKVEIPAGFNESATHTDNYKRNVHPLGRTPALEGPEGYIFSTDAIIRFLANQSQAVLYGRSASESALIDSWVDFSSHDIAPLAHVLARGGKVSKEEASKGAALLENVLQSLDDALAPKTFLVGERLSLADIAVATELIPLYENYLDEATRGAWANLNRWFDTVVNQKNFADQIKTVCKTRGAAAAADAPKKEAKKEEKKPEPKKEEAPKPKKKKDDDDEDDGADDAPKEPTIKNPLDLLPPSPFVLDAYKRLYSNDKGNIRANSGAHLIENLDMAGYSAWLVTFNHCADYPLDFMLPNFLSGFYQRMEGNKLHKYGMGWLYITKQGGARHCEGFFIWRGAEGLPAILKSEVPDTELFTWTKIENLKEHEERIFDFLTGEGKYFEGREWVDWKGFK